MTYSIEFYNAALLAEVEGWPAGINAGFTRKAEQMVESGPNLGLPHTSPLGDGLFEIRAKGEEGISRAFFCALVCRQIVILHGVIKQTRQTPPRELKTARKRLKEVQRGA